MSKKKAASGNILQENKGKVVLLGILLVACGVVAYWNLKPEAPPKPPQSPNVQPISAEEEKVYQQQKKRIEQLERSRPSSGA
jgi:hypothetical protein